MHFDSLLNYTDDRNNTTRLIKPAPGGFTINISKLDWLKQVLEPIHYADFALIEIPIPNIPDREKWKKVLMHIEEAAANFKSGNDPGVFSHCYAVYETIKPVDKHLQSVKNEDKRKAIASIFKNISHFLNKGRHVEKEGEELELFPVDHRDAEYAIILIKSLVAYLAKLNHKI